MNPRESKQDSMNMFSKRTAPTVRNTIPLTLSMIGQIDPNTKKIDDFFEVFKVALLLKVQAITHRLGGKIQIEVLGETDNKEGVLHLFRPKYAAEETDIAQNDLYTFVCSVKPDHGQIVLNCNTYRKVKTQEEINCHHYKISLSDLYRQKRRKQLDSQANNPNKQNQFNQYDI